ncbi:hypothetical protein LUZ63_000808 [Rhynchospora breviuscula]|uniref:F-box domain-containing protein n=1 Tax=Rhynchospora breviuscula TaxID=2022672 RepID=A0A9Q0CX12_9POAL|nr:hypothetical protein LUZ63_000808 [Rhynchospora breviuscula]
MDSEEHQMEVSLNNDRITDLPDDLKCNILARLPLKEMVGTSLLSRMWRYTWASIPNLVFNEKYFMSIRELVRFVDMVLLLHQGPICKFNIYCLDFTHVPIERWMLVLSRNEIEEITIRCSLSYRWRICSCFFSIQSLKKVYLRNCTLMLPHVFCGLKHLQTLNLFACTISDDDLEKLYLLQCGCNLELPLKFEHLKELSIQLTLHDQNEASVAFFLLQNAPNVQYLSILNRPEGPDDFMPIGNLWDLNMQKIALEHLKFVLIDYRGSVTESGLLLVKLLLSAAPLLEKVHIKNYKKDFEFVKNPESLSSPVSTLRNRLKKRYLHTELRLVRLIGSVYTLWLDLYLSFRFVLSMNSRELEISNLMDCDKHQK